MFPHLHNCPPQLPQISMHLSTLRHISGLDCQKLQKINKSLCSYALVLYVHPWGRGLCLISKKIHCTSLSYHIRDTYLTIFITGLEILKNPTARFLVKHPLWPSYDSNSKYHDNSFTDHRLQYLTKKLSQVIPSYNDAFT